MKILNDCVFVEGIYKVKYCYDVEDIKYLKKLIAMVKIEEPIEFIEFLDNFKSLAGFNLHVEDIEKIDYVMEFDVSN